MNKSFRSLEALFWNNFINYTHDYSFSITCHLKGQSNYAIILYAMWLCYNSMETFRLRSVPYLEELAEDSRWLWITVLRGFELGARTIYVGMLPTSLAWKAFVTHSFVVVELCYSLPKQTLLLFWCMWYTSWIDSY